MTERRLMVCRRCHLPVGREAPICPECGADPRTGLSKPTRKGSDRARVCVDHTVVVRTRQLELKRIDVSRPEVIRWPGQPVIGAPRRVPRTAPSATRDIQMRNEKQRDDG